MLLLINSLLFISDKNITRIVLTAYFTKMRFKIFHVTSQTVLVLPQFYDKINAYYF